MYSTHSIDSFGNCILQLRDTQSFDFIYTSIGSKKNEHRVSFHYPGTDLSLTTNATYQMVPQFIRDKDTTDKILIIIIDDFHNEELKRQNDCLLRDIQTIHPNIQFVIVNHILSLKSIENYLRIITDINRYYNLDPSHFMITNFICFKHPNQYQLDFENNIPPIIQHHLDTLQDGYYDNCFYQWYNYAYYTYNYIYCYKTFNLQRLITIQRIHTIIHTVIENDTLSHGNCDKITSHINTLSVSEQKKWDCFLNNSINIAELH